MNFRNIKIRTQLFLGFGIILTFLILLGINSWWQTDKIAGAIDQIYNHPLTVRRALGELTKDILLIQRNMKDLGYSKSDQEFEERIREIETYKQDAQEQIETISDRYLGPEPDIDSIQKSLIIWQVNREETIRMMRNNNREEAIQRTKVYGAGGQQVEKLLSQITTVDNFARNIGDQIFTHTVSLNRQLNFELLFLEIFILMFSVLIVVMIIRNIKRPLNELIMVTQLFQGGRYDARSSYSSKDEFGQLSDSINHLAGNLEDELKLNKITAELAVIMIREEDTQLFCLALLNNLMENTNAQAGAIYLLNDEMNHFEHIVSVGLGKERQKIFSAEDLEGEFGVVNVLQKIKRIRNIPDDSKILFPAVIGKFTPREIITIPVIAGNQTDAIISLVSITGFKDDIDVFLNAVLPMINARMGGVMANGKIHEFSSKLEEQNIELEIKKNELTELTKALTVQNIELEVQKKQLDNANRLKTTFLSNMSHELRTPLNSVIALSGVLKRHQEGQVPKEEHSYFEVIERNGKHLLAIINNILDLAKIESGREDLEITNFATNDLIQDVILTLKPQAQLKELDLVYDVKVQLPEIISDYEKCKHILLNILSNAIKFTDKGKVELIAEVKSKYLYITVSDTGIGIGESNLPHIFDEFRQVDNSSKRYPGTGLGLSIAKKYADMLDGKILVKSQEGKGSSFTLILPIGNGNYMLNNIPGYNYNQLKGNFKSSHVNGKGKSILLVEDSEAMIIQLKVILEEKGFMVITANNGNEALELLAGPLPDAVILDLIMPGMNGFEFLSRLRSSEHTKFLPVMILTAKMVTKEENDSLKHNNIYQLIYKGNINKDEILSLVHRMVISKKSAKKNKSAI